MYDQNDDVTRLTLAAYEMRNRVLADLVRTGLRKLRDTVKRVVAAPKQHHAA